MIQAPALDTFGRHCVETDVVGTLLDLTFYDHAELKSSAFELLVSEFEQRKALRDAAAVAQVLAKDRLAQLYFTCLPLLYQLSGLVQSRRLYGTEVYDAARIIGEFTKHIYESKTVVDESAPSRVAGGRKKGAPRASVVFGNAETVGGSRCYLYLLGIVEIKCGSDLVQFGIDDSLPFTGQQADILGHTYTVKSVNIQDHSITLTEPILSEYEQHMLPPSLVDGGSGKVWFFVLRTHSGPNADLQMLLHNLGVDVMVLRLLELPFTHDRINAEEVELRQLLNCCYRTLNAMCTDFSLVQMALLPHVELFMSHAQANLVSVDITPTDCINSIFKDNQIATSQVTEDRLRKVIKIAGSERAPRYVIFLDIILGRASEPSARNQVLVMQLLRQHQHAQSLYDDNVEERDELIERQDHIVNPRGELAYHIEFIGLLASCSRGACTSSKAMVREMVPLANLIRHLKQDNLPLPLRSNFLRVLNNAYLYVTGVGGGEKMKQEQLPILLTVITKQVERFRSDVLPKHNEFSRDDQLVQDVKFIFDLTVDTLCLIYKNYPDTDVPPDLYLAARSSVNELQELFVSTREIRDSFEGGEASAHPAQFALKLMPLEKLTIAIGHLVQHDSRLRPAGYDPDWNVVAASPVPTRDTKSRTSKLRRVCTVSRAVTSMRAPTTSACEVAPERGKKASLVSSQILWRQSKSPNGGRRIQDGIDESDRDSARNVPPEKQPERKYLPGASNESTPPGVHERVKFAEGNDPSTQGSSIVRSPASSTVSLVVGTSVSMTLAKPKSPSEYAAEARLPGFVEYYAQCMNEEEEVDGLKRALLSDLEKDIQAQQEGATEGFESPVNNLIELLLRGEMEPKKMPICMDILADIFYDGNVSFEQEMLQRKQALATMGICSLILRMVACSENDTLCVKGLTVGIELLSSGRCIGITAVQNRFYEVLSSAGSGLSEVTAIVGPSDTFLATLRLRLRFAIKEIADRKVFRVMQRERRKQLSENSSRHSSVVITSMMTENEKDFPTRAFVHQILTFLRLLCEGHNQKLQNFFRDQPESLFDIDIVSEVVKLTLALEPDLDTENIEQLNLCLELLTELVQGERSRMNAELLLQTKLFVISDRLLTKELGSDIDAIQVVELRNRVLVLLHAVVEGNDPQTLERLRNSLELDSLATAASKWHSSETSVDASDEEVVEMQHENAVMLYMLIWQLLDFNRSPGYKAARAFLEEKSLKEQAARVEIVNAEGALERVYFRVPDKCLMLRKESKFALTWGFDRETPGRQLQQFLQSVEALRVEMQHEVWLRNQRRLHFLLLRNSGRLGTVATGMAVLQNILLVLDTSLAPESHAFALFYKDFSNQVTPILGSLQAFAYMAQVFVHGMRHTVLKFQTNWQSDTGLSLAEAVAKAKSSWRQAVSFCLRSAKFALSDFQLFFYLIMFACAVLALAHHSAFFSFHLLQVLNRNRTLQQALRAVTKNGNQLLIVSFFGCIVVYLYAVWGYYALERNIWKQDELCGSLVACFMSLIDSLANNDVQILMNTVVPASGGAGMQYVNQWGFQFTFFVVVITIQLNMIFGIIIDTFGELRGEQAMKQYKILNECFICGIDRFTFDTKSVIHGIVGDSTGGFTRHVYEDHNMWKYLAMMIHIKDKEPTDYNGWEQHVAQKMETLDVSFLPRNTAIVLQAFQEQEDAALQQLNDKVDKLATQNEKLFKIVEDLAVSVENQPNRRESSSKISTAVSRMSTMTRFSRPS